MGQPRGEPELLGRLLDLEEARALLLAALDPEAFVSGAVPVGGAAFAGDAGVGAYGTREARAMEVTAGAF